MALVGKNAVVVAATLMLTACASYAPRPLTPQALKVALAVRPPTPLWVARAHLLLPQLPPIAVRQGQGLTPDLAAIVAVVADPALRALRGQEAVASAQVLAAGLLPNPTFSYGVGIPLSGAGLTEAFRVGLGLPIRALITRPAREQAARYHAQAVHLTVAWQEWQVAARAKALVYALLVGRRERSLLAREVHVLRHSAELLADAQAAGYATMGAALAARLALHQTELVRLTVRRDYAQKLLALKALLGVGAQTTLRFTHHLPLDDFSGGFTAQTWLKDLPRRRLDLLALRRGYKSQDATLRAVIAGQFPAITVGVNRARDTSDINTLGGGVTMELPIFNHNQGSIALARATRRVLFRSYAARLFVARAEIRRLLTAMRYEKLKMRATRSSVQTLTHLERLYHRALASHRIAALTYYQLLDHAVAERLSLLKDKARREQLAVALETASGRFEWPRRPVKGHP